LIIIYYFKKIGEEEKGQIMRKEKGFKGRAVE
jgi:hypothetical protein